MNGRKWILNGSLFFYLSALTLLSLFIFRGFGGEDAAPFPSPIPSLAKNKTYKGKKRFEVRQNSVPSRRFRKKVQGFFVLTVLDFETKKTIKGISVSVQTVPRTFQSKFWSAFTNKEGRVEVPKLSRVLDLVVSDPKKRAYTFFHKEISLKKDEDVFTVLLREMNSQVLVLVTDSKKRPIAGVPVNAHSGMYFKGTKKTDSQGICVFKGLPSGQNAVEVSLIDGPWRSGRYSLPKVKTQGVRLFPRSLTRVQFVVGLNTGKLKVFLVPKKNSKMEKWPRILENSFIILRSSDSSIVLRKGPIHLDGKAHVFGHLFPGEYSITVFAPKSRLWFGLNPENCVFEIKEGQWSKKTIKVFLGLLEIKGFAFDEDGLPVPGLLVEAIRLIKGADGKGLMLEGAPTLCSQFTDKRGFFHFSHLPPGKFQVFHYPLRMESKNYCSFPGEKAPIITAPFSNLILKLKKAWEVSGHVFFHGKRVCGGRVELMDMSGKRVLFQTYITQDKRGKCGFFRILHVPPGKYTLFYKSSSGNKFVPLKLHLDAKYGPRFFAKKWDLILVK